MKRTKLQERANDTDHSLFNVEARLRDLYDMTKDGTLREAARAISGMRLAVRAHMHPEDREETLS